MSPPISSTVKDRVIQLHLEGKGRNEIAEILTHSRIRISQGSVTNILRTYKANTSEAFTKATSDFSKAPEPSPSQLQTSSTSEKEEPQDSQKEQEETTHGEAQEVHFQSSEVQDQEQQQSFMDSGWSMVFGEVMEAKKQRRDELLLIEQKKKELKQQRMQVDRARYDLENREIKLLEAEPLIPIARQLQDLGTDNKTCRELKEQGYKVADIFVCEEASK